jgi:predicted RNA-binding Zn ribbon-like protein
MAEPMERFARVGNNLSADFVNTVVSFGSDGGTLRSAADVVDFLTATGAISGAEAASVRDRVADAAAAQRFLATALELRNAVTAALIAIEQRQPLGEEPLALINAILAGDAGFDQIVGVDGAYRLERRQLLDDPAVALAPLARDAAGLLAMPNAPVRHCAGAGCVRHFYDDSRTGRRRWCEMAICGNRAKAATFAERRRSGDSAERT